MAVCGPTANRDTIHATDRSMKAALREAMSPVASRWKASIRAEVWSSVHNASAVYRENGAGRSPRRAGLAKRSLMPHHPPLRLSANISTGMGCLSRQTMRIGRSLSSLTRSAGPRQVNGRVTVLRFFWPRANTSTVYPFSR